MILPMAEPADVGSPIDTDQVAFTLVKVVVHRRIDAAARADELSVNRQTLVVND